MSEQDILNSQVYVGKYGKIPDSSDVDTSDYDNTDNDDEVSDEDADRVASILGIDPRDLQDEPREYSTKKKDSHEFRQPINDDDGHWVTGKGGHHIFIDKDGNITKGNPHVVKAAQHKRDDFENSSIHVDALNRSANGNIKKDFIDHWNNNIKLHPDKIGQMVKKSIGLDRGSIVRVFSDPKNDQLGIQINGTIKGKDVHVHRVLDLKDKTLHNVHLELDPDQQGKGTAKKILGNFRKVAKTLGVNKMETHANLHVGGYTWLKYGYLPKDKEESESLLGQVKKRWETTHDVPVWDDAGDIKRSDPIPAHKEGASEEDKKTMENFFKSDPVNNPKAFHVLSDTPIGKKLLLRSDWTGTLDLNNKYQKDRYDAYVNRAK